VAGPTTAEVDSSDVVDFSGTDPITGDAVSLAAYAGKPVVLNFWASWCSPCREELPALMQFAERHPEAAVVGVNLEDTPSGAQALQREIGWPWPSISDPSGERGAKLGLQGMPTTFFLDRDHRVAAMIAGGTDQAGFEEGLALAQGGAS
jgi:thiol-disulfide isomerase/thioredoxin